MQLGRKLAEGYATDSQLADPPEQAVERSAAPVVTVAAAEAPVAAADPEPAPV